MPGTGLSTASGYCCPSLSVLEREVEIRSVETSRLLEERDRRYTLRADRQDKEVATALTVVKDATNRVEETTERRFNSVDSTLDALHSSLSEQLSAISDRVGAIEGKGVGLKEGWGYLVGALGIGGVIVGVIAAFLGR